MVTAAFLAVDLRQRILWARAGITFENLAMLRQFTANTLLLDAVGQLGRNKRTARSASTSASREESVVAANDLLTELRDLFLIYTENSAKLPQHVWNKKVTFGGDAMLQHDDAVLSNATTLANILFEGADEDMDDALTFGDFARLVITLASASQGGAHAQETLVKLLQDPRAEHDSTPLSITDLAELYCSSDETKAAVCRQPPGPEELRVLWRKCLEPSALLGLRGLRPALTAVKKTTDRLAAGEYYSRTEKAKEEEEARERDRALRSERS